jgi:hypothetical protein
LPLPFFMQIPLEKNSLPVLGGQPQSAHGLHRRPPLHADEWRALEVQPFPATGDYVMRAAAVAPWGERRPLCSSSIVRKCTRRLVGRADVQLLYSHGERLI